MTGARLAVKVHIVTSPVTARQNAINAVNRAGLIVADMNPRATRRGRSHLD